MKTSAMTGTSSDDHSLSNDDDILLEEMGYKPSFKREFTNISTVRIEDLEFSL